MNNIAIRQALPVDTGTVSAILQEAANWLIARDTPLWKSDELAPSRIYGEVSDGLFWLAEMNGTPAGCVRFQTEDRLFWPNVPSHKSAFIHRLAVRRKFAGGLVSRALLDWAKKEAAQLGKRYLRLDCEAKATKLCRVYEQAGFRKHSERQVGPYWIARYGMDLTS